MGIQSTKAVAGAKKLTATGPTISLGDLVKITGANAEKPIGTDLTLDIDPSTFESATTNWVSICKVNSTKVAIAYSDAGNSNYITCVIATTDGSSFTIGTPVVIASEVGQYTSVCLTSTDKIAVCYNTGTNGKCAIATISGTTPSFGTAVSYNSGEAKYNSVIAVDTDKIAVSYEDSGNSSYGTCIVATISGTTPSFGSEVVFESATTTYTYIAKLDTDKIAVAYRDEGNSSYGTCIIATISGTVPSFGSAVVFNSADSLYISMVDIDTDKIAIAYRDAGNSYYGSCIVATVSGTVPSFGTSVSISSVSSFWISVTKLDTDKIAIAFGDDSANFDGVALVATISGTVPTVGSELIYESGNSDYNAITSIDTTNAIVAYKDVQGSNYGKVVEISVDFDDTDTNGVAISGEGTPNRHVAVQELS